MAQYINTHHLPNEAEILKEMRKENDDKWVKINWGNTKETFAKIALD